MRLTAVTHDILGDPFWTSFVRGLADAAGQVGCTLQHVSPERYTVGAMHAVLDRAIADRPDGLLTTLPDPAALDARLRAAIDDGLPVIVLNTVDGRPPEVRLPALCTIGSDDHAGGRLAAEKTLAAGSGRLTLCVDHYRVANVCHGQRIEGFSQRVEEAGGRTLRVPIDGADAEGSTLDLERALAEVGDALDGVLTLGPPGWLAVDLALTRSGLAKRVSHVSFDVTPGVLEAIEAGRTLGTIDCQQYLQGYLGVILMSRYVAYGLVPCGDVMTGPRFVDAPLVPRIRARLDAGVG
jgi:simple sugar transport system substrate-binding protein